MVNELLIGLVNSILGNGKKTARGNVAYDCPFCNKHHKLEINFTENKEGENKWACWSCSTKGRYLRSLFKKINVSHDKYIELKSLIKADFNLDLTQLPNNQQVQLPKEFTTFNRSKSGFSKEAYRYLQERNITPQDIIKYNIGFCEVGKYHGRIIIPSYNSEGKLNYFTARSIIPKNPIKYLNPECSRDIIPFEMFINWDLPIILCEGPFDALAIKRNVIPLMGKNLQSTLMKKIVESKVQKIYIALDSDALKKALEFCEKLIDIGKEVYLVEMGEKDPSEMGFEIFTKLIQNITPLTQYKLLEKKLQLV